MPMEANLDALRGRIAAACCRCGRDPSAVRLVAVTKNQPVQSLLRLAGLGVRDIAENRVQEARAKKPALESLPVCWHMVGHLQTNKAREAVRLFDLIHSVDSLRLAREIDVQAKRLGKVQDILLEVHLSGEESKSGIPVPQLAAVLHDVRELTHLRTLGLMGMAPQVADPQQARPYFRRLRELAAGLGLHELSMGMSGDFEAAIEEGATMLRIGRALFA